MKERKESHITIWRETKELLSVPITSSSKRVFKLMSDDYITLDFSLPSAVHIMVGDWCEDELFGRFVVTHEQMPSYNTRTGGYDYSLRLDAPYRALGNRIHTLPSRLVTTNEKVRKETNWTLTDNLANHANAIVEGASLVGGDIVGVEITAEKAQEVRMVAYNGVSILEAIGMVADEFETEWWVKDGILHFDKCEGTNEPYVFSLGDNVESMNVQDDVQDYCNSIFAFGGTTNIPSTYRRSLSFKVTSQKTISLGGANYESFADDDKKVTLGMIHGGNAQAVFSYRKEVTDLVLLALPMGGVYSVMFDGSLMVSDLSNAHFSGSVGFYYNLSGTGNCTIKMQMLAIPTAGSGASSYQIASRYVGITSDTEAFGYEKMDIETDVKLPEGTYSVRFEASLSHDVSLNPIVLNTGECWASGKVTANTESVSTSCKLVFNGAVYTVEFNPLGVAYGEEDYYRFVFRMGNERIAPPDGFGIGSEYRLLLHGETYGGVVTTNGLEPTETPLSWWVRDYDNPSSIWSIGENRLMLPIGAQSETMDIEGSRMTRKGVTPAQTVERSVVFEEIHPRCILVVTEVRTMQKQTREEHEDGSQTAWQWVQYIIKCRTIDNTAFPFRRKYVKPGETLRARFMTLTDADTTMEHIGEVFGAEPRLLMSGMEFDVSYDNASDEYTLVRNDNYGTMLPNETLCPTVGDLFTLSGWDVRAMSSLGLVESAEERLLAHAEAYLMAMDEGQYVFTCDMMSDWMFHTEDGYIDLRTQTTEGAEDFHESSGAQVKVWHVMPIPFITASGEPLLTDGRLFHVVNNHYFFLLPTEGARVMVRHDALKAGEKTSRIIGYELKLDKPYDTPRYTIGETEAYSRLKRMEKVLGISK